MKTIANTCALLLVAMTLLAACRPQEVEKPRDEVTVQLEWIHQAQFAGMYAAAKKGFYVEEDIAVTLNPGGPDLLPDQAVADLVGGKADFAIIGGDRLLAARSRGNPIVPRTAYGTTPGKYGLRQAVHHLYPEPERDESIVMAYSPGDDAFVIACDHFMWPGHSRVYRYLT